MGVSWDTFRSSHPSQPTSAQRDRAKGGPLGKYLHLVLRLGSARSAKRYGAQEYYESWHGQKVLSLQRGGPYRQELSQESITTAAAALLQLWKGGTHQEGLPLANATQSQRCTR